MVKKGGKYRMYYKVSRVVKIIIIVMAFFFCMSSTTYLKAADITSLIQNLNNNDLLVRLNAIEALGDARDARAVEPLVAALGDESCGCAASNALVKIGNTSVEPLIVALKDENMIVRRNAAKALGEMKDARAVEPLIATLKDEDATVRWQAAKALGEMKDARAIEPLVSTLKDDNPIVRWHAANALENIGAPSVEPLISDILY